MKRWMPVVDPAAEIGRGDAEDGAERRADERRGEADHQRGARAVDEARADVAAVRVGAAPVLPATAPPASRRSRSSADRRARPSGEKMPANIISDDDDEARPRRAAAGGMNSTTASRGADGVAAGAGGDRRSWRVTRTGCADRAPRRAGRPARLTKTKKAAISITMPWISVKSLRADALHEQLADAVEVEHLLGHDQAADQEGELEADHGDRRQQRVAQRVARDHELLVHALGARGADVVLAASPRAATSASCASPPRSSGSRPRAPARSAA